MKLLIALFFICIQAFPQVGIGTTDIHPSAILEVKSNNTGFLPPRMTAFQRDEIPNPTSGLMLYCTNCCGQGNITFFDGDEWVNTPSCEQSDFDNDGILDSLDVDDDNDGVLDKDEDIITELIPQSLCMNSYKTSDDILYYDPILFPTGSLSISKGSIYYLEEGENAVILIREHVSNTIIAKMRVSIKHLDTPNTNLSLGLKILPHNQLEIRYTANSSVFKQAHLLYEFFTPAANTLNLLKGLNTETKHTFSYSLDFGDIDKNDLRSEMIKLPKVTNVNLVVESANSYIYSEKNDSLIVEGTIDDPTSPIRFIYNNVNAFEIIYLISGPKGHFENNLNCSAYTFIKPLKIIGHQKDLDSDNDGIPNRKDLDSDNDSCSDAKESGRTISNLTNFQFNANVGKNGYHNSLESGDIVPVILLNPNSYNLEKVNDGNCD